MTDPVEQHDSTVPVVPGVRCYTWGMDSPDTVTVYTDGACRGNPGPGGWAALLIAALTGDDSGRALDLVRATINLGHALGLRIVAEGIEDYATLELLTDLSCDLGQGNFISQPKPAHRVTLTAKLADSQPAAHVG